jgi:hypothetical protein
MKDYKDIGIQFNYSDEQIKFFLQSGISQDVGKKMGGNAIIFCCSKNFKMSVKRYMKMVHRIRKFRYSVLIIYLSFF